MTTRFREVVAVALAAGLLGFSTGSQAGLSGQAIQKLRDQQQSDQQSNSGSDSSDQHSDRGADHRSDRQPSSPPPRKDSGGRYAPPPAAPHDDSRGADRGRDRAPGANPGGDVERLRGNDRGEHGDRDSRGNRDYRDYRGGSRGEDHYRRPPRVVERLPSGRRDYYWNGSHYYMYGGHWYRPYGSSFITIGIPFGLFVATLPGYYTTFWFDGTRYFYADNTYYVYDTARNGYVVSHSPYGDDQDQDSSDATNAQGDDLYVYPAKGQSEQQQADDRYECHRWAGDQAHYDPLKDDYDAGKNAEYRRAMIACLTGKGYSVN